MKLAAFLFLASTTFAQSPTVPPNRAELTHTEQVAIQALVQQFQQQLALIAEDVKHDHPGYQLNPQTLQLQPMPVQAPAKPAETPKK